MDRSSARITKMKNKLEFDLSFCRPGEHEGVVNTMGWERSVQIRKEEIWKLSVSLRSSVFSRSADRSAKNREISIDLSLPFSLSLSIVSIRFTRDDEISSVEDARQCTYRV